jgi:hypothetical protein
MRNGAEIGAICARNGWVAADIGRCDAHAQSCVIALSRNTARATKDWRADHQASINRLISHASRARPGVGTKLVRGSPERAATDRRSLQLKAYLKVDHVDKNFARGMSTTEVLKDVSLAVESARSMH